MLRLLMVSDCIYDDLCAVSGNIVVTGQRHRANMLIRSAAFSFGI